MRLPFLHHSSALAPASYAAEFLATFCLTLAVSLSLTGAPVVTPLVAALTLGIFVYTVGPISGAHVNPAVTIGLASAGKINPRDAVLYVIAQLLGAVVALLIITSIGAAPTVAVDDAFPVAIGEAFGAFLLTFGVSSVAFGKVHEAASGIVVGLSLLLGISFASTVSNGVLNPAVAVGIGSVSLFYLLAPVLGGVLGAQAYRLLAGGRKKAK